MLATKLRLLLVLSFVFSMEAFAERQWPEKAFDCQVVTNSGSQGLVSLQTFSLKDAQAGAVGLPATTELDNHDVAIRVLQCIEHGKGSSFADAAFQAWFENLAQ